MVDINSSNYHDFVIKDGKFIGEFEQMYVKSKDIPWHQDKQENWLDIRLTIQLLKEYSPFDYICDFGCGLGYFLDILKRKVGTPECKLVGYDASPTCLKKAKVIFPTIKFYMLDLMKDNKQRDANKNRGKEEKKLFAIRGSLWYVFPNMENVVRNIVNKVGEGGFLLISQNFPPLTSNFVGKNVIPNPEAIVTWFSKSFSPLKTIWLKDNVSKGNDNWFIGLFLRRV